MASKKKVPALVLTLGGAPATWHQIVGLPGWYHIDHPTPVGGEGELSLEQAKDHDAHEGTAVKLVQVPEDDLEHLRELQTEQLGAAVQAISAQASVLDGAEAEQARDELAAAGATGAPVEAEPSGWAGEEQTIPEVAGESGEEA